MSGDQCKEGKKASATMMHDVEGELKAVDRNSYESAFAEVRAEEE